MDQQKIDRLFREKLDTYEVLPSGEAWTKVEKQIGAHRSSAKFYWIAASISLIIIGWIIWPKEEIRDFRPIASEVNHPTVQEGIQWSIPAVESVSQFAHVEESVVEPTPATTAAQETPVKQLVAQEDAIQDDVVMKQDPTIGEEAPVLLEEILVDSSATRVALEIPLEQPAMELDEDLSDEIDYTQIKITYIAGEAEKVDKKDSVGGFKKIIAFAGKLSPGEVLADLKTAKDGFINGGFKSKNKNRSSL